MTRPLLVTGLVTALGLMPTVVAGQAKPTTLEEMHKLHQNSKAYIALLEDPARDAYQKPHEILMALAVKGRGTNR